MIKLKTNKTLTKGSRKKELKSKEYNIIYDKAQLKEKIENKQNLYKRTKNKNYK